MSMTDEGGADAIGPGADATAAGPPAGPPSGPPGGGAPGQPPGGGPILAALAHRQRNPQVSAPGPGDTAHSMTLLMQAVGLCQQALPGLPTNSPMHRDCLKAITSLSRHANQGQPTAGVQQTQLQDLLRNVVRNAMLSRIMGQQGNQGQPQAGPSGTSPMQAASAAPPMPSTPMPGA